jgi:hypothetical protein
MASYDSTADDLPQLALSSESHPAKRMKRRDEPGLTRPRTRTACPLTMPPDCCRARRAHVGERRGPSGRDEPGDLRALGGEVRAAGGDRRHPPAPAARVDRRAQTHPSPWSRRRGWGRENLRGVLACRCRWPGRCDRAGGNPSQRLGRSRTDDR